MKDVFRSGDSAKKFKITDGQLYRYAPSYVAPAYHLLDGFPFIQEPPSGDLQERVLIRQHDYDQCFLFFLSSRRRHTILQGDWSSDVCSSDLRFPAVTSSNCTEESRSKICPMPSQETSSNATNKTATPASHCFPIVRR